MTRRPLLLLVAPLKLLASVFSTVHILSYAAYAFFDWLVLWVMGRFGR